MFAPLHEAPFAVTARVHIVVTHGDHVPTIAVLMLGTGDIGLILSGAPQWSPQVFDGVVLIAAVGTTVVKRGGSTIHVGGL